MKTKKVLYFLLIVVFAFFMASCEKDEDPINEFNVLTSYLEDNDLDWINDMTAWNISEAAALPNIGDYLVLDLRSATDFAATVNPIPGAVNVTLANMFDTVESLSKTAVPTKILVTCYSGQTAAYAHMLLRMKGYEAYLMLWGMSLHSQANDKWSTNVNSPFVGHENWVTTVSPALPTFDYPELNTGEETGEAILDKRIEAAIAAWPTALVAGTTVMDNQSSYNIMNYWVEADYLSMGHFSEAYQLTPKTLTTDGNLSVFDPIGTNIFYCYTGQTAAAAIAYLTVLGYDVKSIKFGTNSMIYSAMPGHKWSGTPSYLN